MDWHQRGALADDLEAQHRAIVTHIGPHDPDEALALMWRFMALSQSVFERCDDSDGLLGGLFDAALDDLGELAGKAATDAESLADTAYDALNANHYGQYDRLITVLAPALGAEGLAHLKQRMIELSNTPVRQPADAGRQVVGYGFRGPIYADEMAEWSRKSTVRLALMEIADRQGDVDAFIGQYDEDTQKVPKIAADIAQRLLAAGRTEQAWQTLEAAKPRDNPLFPDFEFDETRIAVLDAMDRGDDAQTARWAYFARWLSIAYLRAYLKNLPADADDFEAEEKARDVACSHDSFLTALDFLVSWPELDRAAQLVLQRADELNGNIYQILTPAAEALAGRHPLATTLLLRSMIDFALSKGRTKRYKHAARHLDECASLATSIEDFGAFETHAAYEAGLRRTHGKKTSFWNNVA